MRFITILLLLSSTCFGQFPGLGSIKDKLDQANRKTAPVTDRAQRARDTFTPWSAEEEQELGQASAEKLVAVFGLLDDPALERYVNLVGGTVAQFAERPLAWRFGILNTNIVGAFALPGGYVFVTRGAVSGMSNEAQLAGVLGHEIEHAAARHLEEEIRSRKTSAWAAQEALARTNRGPAELRSRADALVKDLLSTALSRAKEEDADQQGARMAARAGYSSSGLLEFLRLAEQASSEPGGRRYFGQLLATHPSFQERIERLQALPPSRGKTLDARFHQAIGR